MQMRVSFLLALVLTGSSLAFGNLFTTVKSGFSGVETRDVSVAFFTQEKLTKRIQGNGFPKSAYQYARLVEPELGVPPKVNLDKAVEIPIYVAGVQKYGNLGHSCDNPTRLGKETVSGSVIQRYEGRTAEGKPLPDVVWVAFGRNSSDDPKDVIGSVQMIGYNRRTGATAFFESSDRIDPWVNLDERTLRMRGTLPWIDDPKEFDRAFVPPGNTQCVECHQADPFITNTFINGAKIPGTNDAVVPVLDDDSPYYVIGGENWDMRTIHIEDNSCFDCHRVGQNTLKLFMNNGWDPNKHMPPNAPGSLSDDLRELLKVWGDGPDNVDGAEWIIPPSQGRKRQVVGDDYPHQSAFNKPDLDHKKFSKNGKKEEEWQKNNLGGKNKSLSDVEKQEVTKLLQQLPDAGIRRLFEDWIEKNGADQEILDKLRGMVKSY